MIQITISNSLFKDLDVFLAEQEFTSKPKFNNIKVSTETDCYNYTIGNLGDKYYIVTD